MSHTKARNNSYHMYLKVHTDNGMLEPIEECSGAKPHRDRQNSVPFVFNFELYLQQTE